MLAGSSLRSEPARMVDLGPLAALLLLAGATIGLLPSADLGTSLGKLASLAIGLLVLLHLPAVQRRGLSAIAWLATGAGLLLSVAGNIQIDRNSWKLDALNAPVYAWFSHLPRLDEAALNQNAVAAYLILAIPLAGGLFYGSRHLGARFAAGIALVLLLGELLLTECRAALLALAAAAALGAWHAGGRRRWLALGAPVLAVGLLATGWIALPVTLGWLPTGASSQERLAIWQSALTMIADAPLTGVGLGMFQQVYSQYMLPAFHTTQPHAHNLLLEAWSETGVLGAAGMVLLMFDSTRRVLARPADALAAGAAVSSAAILLQAQVDSYFAGDARTYWVMFIPLALLRASQTPAPGWSTSAVWKRTGNRVSGISPARQREVFAGLLLAGAVLTPWPRALVWTNIGTVERLTGRPAAAQQAFNNALAADGRDWPAERGLALLHSAAGDHATAVVLLQRAERDGARGALIHFDLGQALGATGQTSAAIAEWRLAGAGPHLTLEGQRAADPEQAEELFQLALDVDPASLEAAEGLAAIFVSQGRISDAAGVLAATHDHLWLGLLDFWLEGDRPAALQQLQAAAAEEPAARPPEQALADVLSAAGRPEQAQVWQARARRLAQQAYAAHDGLALAYEALGLYPQARKELARLAPDPIAAYDMGQLDVRQGALREGIEHLRQAVSSIPNQESFRLALASAYVKSGETRAARDEYRAALTLDPGAPAPAGLTCPAGCRA